MYTCKKCGGPADVINQKIVKTCGCEGGVLMDMGTAKLKSFGSMKEKMSVTRQAALLINHIVARVKKIHGEIQRR